MRAELPGLCLTIVFVVLALFSAPVSAQTINGIVLEDVIELPIELARVVLVTLDGDSITSALTDENGFFSLGAGSAGRFVLVASALGYRTARSERIEIEDDEVRVTQMHLALRPIPVAGVVVESEIEELVVPELVANGFYERRQKGWGEFLTPGQIRNHPATYTPQLFREMQTVRLFPNRGRGTGPWNDSVQIVKNVGGGLRIEDRTCTPYIWVDDVLIQMLPGESLDDVAPKETIEAIEVHRAPFGAPLRYLRDFDPDVACGAILIWTNRR